MKRKTLFIGLAVIACLIIENAIILEIGKIHSENQNKLVITSSKGKSQSIDLDLKAIANNYRTQQDIIALKDITGDNNIDKEVQNQLNNNIKSIGGEQKFLEQLKNINSDKNKYTENLEMNLLFNKALATTTKNVKVSDSEAQKALKDGSTEVPEKQINFYMSPNKQLLLNLKDELNSKNKITLPKDVQDGMMKVGHNNTDFWNVIGKMPDGNCSEILTVGANNLLIYNISSISQDAQLKDAVNNLQSQRAIGELDKKIDAEINAFTYQIK